MDLGERQQGGPASARAGPVGFLMTERERFEAALRAEKTVPPD